MHNKLPKLNPRYRIWLSQAEYDLQAAINCAQNGYFEWTCFICEQCAEKALKSIIIANDRVAPKIHKLQALVNIAKRYDDRFINIDFEVKEISVFTFIARYPFLIPGELEAPHIYISLEDARLCITKTTKILETIQSLLND